MSHAVIKAMLRGALQRQPTPEEFDRARMEGLKLCPEGRVYLSPNSPSEVERRDAILNLRNAGMSIRCIARTLKCHRREVREVVGPNLALNWPRP